MGFATHLGPWLLGTVKNTTGSAAGTVRNTGCTIVAQNFNVPQTASGTITAGALPAGALITSIQLITPTTAFTSGTISISVAGTVVVNAASLPTTLGVTALTVATTGATRANNVGATDALVTYTLGTPVGTGAASTLDIANIVRESDGATAPTASQQ